MNHTFTHSNKQKCGGSYKFQTTNKDAILNSCTMKVYTEQKVYLKEKNTDFNDLKNIVENVVFAHY